MRRRSSSFRSRVVLACVPVLGLAMLASTGTAAAARAPVHTRANLRAALEHLLAGWHPTSHGVYVLRGTGLKKEAATSWSGYADTGTGFSTVTGQWTQPKVTGCSATGPEKFELFWVGLDGFTSTSKTVEQGSTAAACGTGFGGLKYFTWWAMGSGGISPGGGDTVKPGDKISASVVRKGTSYTIKVTDSTTPGNSFGTTQTCSTCANSSAEWIGERAALPPSEQLSPLPDFGTWTLSGATAKAGSKSGTIKTFPDYQITMINKKGGHVMAQPGALNSAGNSFKDTWKASS